MSAPVPLRAPFPWFGGKSRAAHLVWAAMGDVGAYCAPFAGSLAVELARPNPHGLETVNDIDGYLVNFWRATRAAPDEVLAHASGPSAELDLAARHRWLVETARARVDAMRDDPDAFDAQIAGWWLWGICRWIGSGWCVSGKAQAPAEPKGIGAIGKASPPRTRLDPNEAYMRALSDRIREMRILCGDWSRAVSPASLVGNLRRSGGGRRGVTGVFLDPPYRTGADLYSVNAEGVFDEVCEWAEEHGNDPHLRIVLCGHAGDWTPPGGWQTVRWTGRKAFASTKGSEQLETLWCSPACLQVLRPTQGDLLEPRS